MVVNISRVLSADLDVVHHEIRRLTDIIHGAGPRIKVIFENCWLQDSQKIRLCEICRDFRVV